MIKNNLEVILLCPTGQDAFLISEALKKDGIYSSIVRSSDELFKKKHEDMDVIIIAEEALSSEAVDRLNSFLLAQEPWSEIPVILLTAGHVRRKDLIAKRLESFIISGNVTILERPLRPLTLMSAVKVALRARKRQYQMRDLLISQTEATKIRDDFISIAGHELKTPLTSLKLQAQMTQKFLRGANLPNSERMLKQVDYTINQVDRLNKLVDDMLDITRINKGKLQLDKRECNLSQLLNELIERFLPQFEAAGCKVITDITDSVVGLWDGFKIEQVINNLFTNAIRYAPGTNIEIKLNMGEEKAILTVADEGPGLKPQNLEKIFERFEKGESNSKGLGLGLYISREIIELHQGSIKVESEWGKGAKFIIELPLTV